MEGDTRYKRFECTPLQSPASEIRLVSLSESPETYLLSLTLKTCQLNNATPYIGVSYEWGEVEPKDEEKAEGATAGAQTDGARLSGKGKLCPT